MAELLFIFAKKNYGYIGKIDKEICMAGGYNP